MKVIELKDHNAVRDISARLINWRDKHSIYRTNDGYVACLNYPYCIAGLFQSAQSAREAQTEVLTVREVR